MKILVVEDDAGAADLIAAGLAARGHEATVARDGREGFSRASADRFDVIVLDRMLPQLDGLSVVALMRAEGVSTPVLFLTNLSGIDDRVDGLEAGGDDYLVKPFAFEELGAPERARAAPDARLVDNCAEGRRPGNGSRRPHRPARRQGRRPATA